MEIDNSSFVMAIGMLVMFAYGVALGNIFGILGYISVLITGIGVFSIMIINLQKELKEVKG